MQANCIEKFYKSYNNFYGLHLSLLDYFVWQCLDGLQWRSVYETFLFMFMKPCLNNSLFVE